MEEKQFFNSTTEYDKFKFLEGNRIINEKKVISMIESIKQKNFLKEYPILVDAKFGILDGQHRFEAARRLQIPIYYIATDRMTISDVAETNKTVQRWQMNDYIKFYATKGNQEYIKLMKYSATFGLSTEIILRIFGLNDFSYTKTIRNGDFIFHPTKEREGLKLYALLRDAEHHFKYVYQRAFIQAFRKLSKHPEYDHENMKTKMEYLSKKMVRCVDQDSYASMLEEIYNYRTKNKIKVTK